MKVRTHFNMAKITLRCINGNNEHHKYSLINRISLYIGSMIPDLNFVQIIKHPHFYQESSNYVFNMISELKKRKKINILFMLKLGIIMHYLNDFCCHVHKSGGIGNVNEHIIYERNLNKYLLMNKETIFNKIKGTIINNKFKDISLEIKNILKEYYKAEPSYILDINKSITMNILVFCHVLEYLPINQEKIICNMNSNMQFMNI